MGAGQATAATASTAIVGHTGGLAACLQLMGPAILHAYKHGGTEGVWVPHVLHVGHLYLPLCHLQMCVRAADGPCCVACLQTRWPRRCVGSTCATCLTCLSPCVSTANSVCAHAVLHAYKRGRGKRRCSDCIHAHTHVHAGCCVLPDLILVTRMNTTTCMSCMCLRR